MYYFSNEMVCGTCRNWDGLRTVDEQGIVCVFPNVVGMCSATEKLRAPNLDCREQRWVKWEANGPDYLYMSEIKCWEYTGCGYEEGGENAAIHGVCPAYPNDGRQCSTLNDTKCHIGCNAGKSRFPLPGKRSCQQCGFYKTILSLDA